MTLLDPTSARDFLEAAVAAFSVLGGVMAYASGFAAAQALRQEMPSDVVAHRINEGIGSGFTSGSVAAVCALIIMVWT